MEIEAATKKKRYESEMQTVKRVEKYYPDPNLKKQLNEYMMQEGCKSELAVTLLRAFFRAKRQNGGFPTVIVLNP